MERFDELWKSAAGFRKVAPELRDLLEEAWLRLTEGDVAESKRALEKLLHFLASPDGRTDANCTVTDYFFSAAERIEGVWDHLPADLRAILTNIGGCLHDTVHAPEIAENFESTPEQLLERVRAVTE